MRSIRPRAWEIRLRAAASYNSPCWRQITRRLQYDWIIRKGETWWPPTVLCAPAGVSLVTKLPRFISQKCFSVFLPLSASKQIIAPQNDAWFRVVLWFVVIEVTEIKKCEALSTDRNSISSCSLSALCKKSVHFAWAQKIIPRDVFTKPYWNKWITQPNTLNTPS